MRFRMKEVGTSLFDSLYIITNLPIALCRSSRNMQIVNIAHNKIFLILLRNTSRHMLKYICLLSFPDKQVEEL